MPGVILASASTFDRVTGSVEGETWFQYGLHNLPVKLPFFSKDPVGDFWTYFSEVAPQIAKLGQPDAGHIAGIGSRLNKIDRRLAWQMGPHGDEWSLEISAEGVQDVAPSVHRTVDRAPQIPGWHVFAFRQKIGNAASLQMNGATFDPGKVWFDSRILEDKLHAVFLVEGMTAQNKDAWTGAIFIFLDSLLGEYEVMTKLGHLEFKPLSGDDDRTLLRKLDQIPSVFDAM